MKQTTNYQKLFAALQVVAKKKNRHFHKLGAVLSLITTLGMTTPSAHADGSKSGSWNWAVVGTDFYSKGWTSGTEPNNQKPSGLRTWSGTNTSFTGQGGWFSASWTAANGNWIPDISRSGGASGLLSTMVPNYTINWTGSGNITSTTGSTYTFGLKFELGVRDGWYGYNKVDSYEAYIVTHTNKTLAQQQATGTHIGTVTPPGETVGYDCYLADAGDFYQLWAFRKVNSWSGPVNVHAILKHWAERSGTPFNVNTWLTWRAWAGFSIAAETFDTAGNFKVENIQIPNLDTLLATGLVNGGIYELEPKNASGKRLDVSGVSTSNGAQVHIWDDVNGSNQRWKLEEQSIGIYELTPQHATGKRLDVNGASTVNGSKVQIWDDNNGNNQRWKLELQSDGYYELIPQHATGKRLDVSGYGTTNGSQVHIWDDTNADNQRWKLLKQ